MAALVLTFLALAVFTVLTAAQTRAVAHAASHSVRQSDLYQRARYWVGAEQSLEREYRLHPSAATLTRYASAAGNVRRVLRAALTAARPDEQPQIGQLLTAHDQYVQAVNGALFPAVRTNDAVHVDNIDRVMIDPVFTQLEAQVDGAARTHRQASSAQLAHLTRLQDTLAALVLTMCTAGPGLLVFLWSVLRRQEGRVDDMAEAAAPRPTGAVTDPLTSLGTRRAFDEDLGAALRAGALDGVPWTVVRLDLDGFQAITAQGGQGYGDHVLSSFGHVLGAAFPGQAYRVGGDEFALLLPVSGERAAGAVDDLCTRLAAAALPTISAGLTTTTSGHVSPGALHQRATEALREARRRGRNRQVTFEELGGRPSVPGQEQADAVRDLRQADSSGHPSR